MTMDQTGTVQRKLWLLALVGLFFSLGFAWTLNREPHIRGISDIYLRWYATDKLFTDGRDLYDSRTGEELRDIVYGNERQPISNFFYPAHLILFTAPLAFLPYPVAHLVWTVLVQIFYWLAIVVLVREVGWPVSTNQITLFLVGATLFLPALQHTIWGQFNTIGVLSLALCYVALRANRYALAGVLAIGLTIKPQTTLIPLCFLLFWAFAERKRWRFLLGFGAAGLLVWLSTEAMQPGWVFAFLEALQGYPPQMSILDKLWNPYQLLSTAFVVVALVAFFSGRRMPVNSAAFAGCLSLSIAVNALIIPIIGMMHLVLIPVAMVLLLGALGDERAAIFHFALLGFMAIYLIGWILFLWGLSAAGEHLSSAENASNLLFPLFVACLSLPLCLQERTRQLRINSVV